ncbi:hypothetical protein GN244_ATG07840 [Phytophthora infestans]|uniref:Uncharacterized protein n=1 Tax=Phytophthora infestans TaxID=4787 RepID=A0A833SZ02_PHYIN|nr:hypothetical protein GN244_ATG07840 [Phytophthora infestans]
MDYLAVKFHNALRKWKAAPYFRTFLGIGSHANDKISPFNVGHVIKMEHLVMDQMSLLEIRFIFPKSLQRGIMDCSYGAPGVFASLIRFMYNNTYHRIQSDQHSLTELERVALKHILEGDGGLTTSTVEGKSDSFTDCCIAVQRSGDTLAIVSEMMHQVYVEAIPALEIVHCFLLSVALRHVSTKYVSNHLVRNGHAPSEAVFHRELYSTIRGILTEESAEAKKTGSRRRANILIANGIRLAYEVKSNLLRESEIEATVKQASTGNNSTSTTWLLLTLFLLVI